MVSSQARANSAAVKHWYIPLSYLGIGILALVLRSVYLGHFLTFDEANFWMGRSATFLNALQTGNYAATAISTHPGVTTMWLGAMGIILRRLLFDWGLLQSDPFPLVLALLRLPVVLAHVSGLLVGYALLRRLLAPATAALAAVLWATDPFVVGYSQLLHVDALAGTFITVSLLAGAVYWHRSPQRRFLLLSGVAGGAALLSKSPALALLPAIALLALWRGWDEGGRDGLWRALLPLLGWGLACATTTVALWPALWAGPVQALHNIQLGVVAEGAQPHMLGNFFLGQPDPAPGPLYYPVALALRLTPLTLAGILLLAPAWRHARTLLPERRALAVLALFAVMFIVAMSLFPKKFNRYLVPIFPAIDILAACGLVWGVQRLAQLARVARAAGPALAVLAVAAAVNAATWQPYSIAAYNQLLGGARAGAEAFSTGWGEGYDQIADFLNQQPNITSVATVGLWRSVLQPFLKPGAQTIWPKETLPPEAGYLIVYMLDVQNGSLPPFDRFYQRETPVFVAQIHGVPYAWVYQLPPPVELPHAADFGPAIHLRGLNAEGEAQRGATQDLTLFWKSRAAITNDYMLFAHLIGPDGQRYAQFDLPYTTSTWEPGRIVETHLPLTLPDNGPVGTYRLYIGLYEPATGQRLPLSTPTNLDPALDGPHALPVMELRLE
ncbi:MAG TPA: glycosyltransferase family 39 protein [Roseiflexaceae bacterium]|nr:glycosyltransferase family 39 protein [Roseiflexaceae bacterium]